jgi:hypothetical protein
MEDGDLLLGDVHPQMETCDYSTQDIDTAKKDVNPAKQVASASINGSCRR